MDTDNVRLFEFYSVCKSVVLRKYLNEGVFDIGRISLNGYLKRFDFPFV